MERRLYSNNFGDRIKSIALLSPFQRTILHLPTMEHAVEAGRDKWGRRKLKIKNRANKHLRSAQIPKRFPTSKFPEMGAIGEQAQDQPQNGANLFQLLRHLKNNTPLRSIYHTPNLGPRSCITARYELYPSLSLFYAKPQARS